MAEFFRHIFQTEPELPILGLLGIVLVCMCAFARRYRQPSRAKVAARRPAKTDDAVATRTVDTGKPLTSEMQSQRLFALLDGAAASLERAVSAHNAAAKHLDSAEYQLLRLFQEFPALAANRRPAAALASGPVVDAPPRLMPSAIAA